jgi:hypothetical protein
MERRCGLASRRHDSAQHKRTREASAMLCCIADSSRALNSGSDRLPKSTAVMPDFAAQMMQVGQLLAHPYVIEAPVYQRSFAWGEREGKRLLANITEALTEAELRGSGDYFLGTMLFIDRDGAPSRLSWPRARAVRALEVVDGFQRLTTLTILLCVLRDLDGDPDGPVDERLQPALLAGKDGTRPRLVLRAPDDEFFRAYVREPGATRRHPPADGLSPAAQNVLQVRNHFIAMLQEREADERARLVDYLLDRCSVVMVATSDIDRAYHTFTVLNTAGKPLARNEVLKALLLGRVPADAAPRCLEIWKEAEARLGPDFESLFSHIRAMYGRLGGQVIAGIAEIARANGGAPAFIERILRPAVGIFDDIRNGRHAGSPYSARIVTQLRYLAWHSFSDWIPAAMLWWLNRGEDAKSLQRFLARLDRLAVGARILGIGSSKRTRRFDAVVTAIREGRDLDGADSPLEFSRQELRTIQHNLRDLHARNASTAKQILLRLTDVRAGGLQSLSLPNDMTVEHILPRTLRANCQWRECFPDPEERELCTESLGNLVLVTKAQNDKASNHDFARKLQVYFNTRGAPVPTINEDLRGRSQWKPADIHAREASMLQQIEELWQFGLGTPKTPARGAAEASALSPSAP